MKPTILAIESSCDETSASVVTNGKVLNNIIATQTIHEKYGGVVPELASRAHIQHIVLVVEQSLNEANISKNHLDAIAFTQGPGLLGSLLVGASFAKAMAQGLNIPIIGVNHMKGHILSHFIDKPVPKFPFICLTVSGGHTQIVLVKDYLKMEILGETLDDAVGEAFDKSAKLLGLSYPGGKLIDDYALNGNPNAFIFPTSPMKGYNYSFSGIKTAFMYFLREKTAVDDDFINNNMKDICASLQFSLIKILMNKLIKCADEFGIKEVAIAGGVSANRGLRLSIEKVAKNKEWNVYLPDFQYCTDNAAMIAMAAHFMYLDNQFADLRTVSLPRMKF